MKEQGKSKRVQSNTGRVIREKQERPEAIEAHKARVEAAKGTQEKKENN